MSAEEIEQLREATREAHAATKDLRAALKEARELLKQDAGEMVVEAVRVKLDEMGEATNKAMDAAVDKVGAEFTKLANIYLGIEPGTIYTLDELTEKTKRLSPLIRVERRDPDVS